MSISTAPQLAPLNFEAGTWQNRPETILVAGIRNVDSLGWSVARNWLEGAPSRRLIATYRSEDALEFLERQSGIFDDPNKITSVEIDWLDDDPASVLGWALEDIDKKLLTKEGIGLSLAGVAHCVASADRSNFTKPPTEIDDQVYIDAFKASTLSLKGLVKACLPYLVPSAGVVTFGYGEPDRTEVGYGGAMQNAKASLTKTVMALAEELGQPYPNTNLPKGRIIEITTGYITSRSGKAVAVLQKTKPKDAEAKSSEKALLAGTNGSLQANTAGEFAVLHMVHPAFSQLTAQRIHIDGGASARSSTIA